MSTFQFLKLLVEESGISGHELNLKDHIISSFNQFSDRYDVDKLGNLIFLKKGNLNNNNNNIKIMLATHMDEIGLMVKDIEENGFIRFTNIGGIDPRTIIGQEVIIHGKRDYLGVIVSKPPHLQNSKEQEKAIEFEDMIIDIGMKEKEVREIINIGDPISINRNLHKLLNNRVSSKALDNRASIAALLECMKELSYLKHQADIHAVATVQEEVGMSGAFTSAFKINPDIGIAIDVGFGRTPELNNSDTIELGKGPGITLGGNIHSGLRDKLVSVANKYNIPYQMEITPGPTATDARAIQITKHGIPCLVISIPLRYMHTSVEVVDMEDIKNTGRLLAFFIKEISNENLGELLCY